MLIITIYEMSNASGGYPVAKSQDHQRWQSEELVTFCEA